MFAAVLCALNSKYVHSSLAPWCLLAGVKAYCPADIQACVVEGTINEALTDISARIAKKQPAVVGLSCYIWNITPVLELVRILKAELPQAVIVLGGPEVSYNAAEVLTNNSLVDYIVSGEGERPFALLLNALYQSTQVKCIPGVCGRTESGVYTSQPYTPEDEPPSPYTEEYFSALNGRIAYLETSRGCPFSCAFCLSGRCGGVRSYPLERAKKELLCLAVSGTQTVKLVDRTFNANRPRALELFRFILQNYGRAIPPGVCFHFEVAGDLLDDETITLLAQAPAGAIQLEIGLQSFNPLTLAAIHRKTDITRLTHNLARVIGNGNMHIHLDLIAGLPFEDYASFAQSFNTAFALRPNMLQLGFLKLLHGAPMRENPQEYPCSYSDKPPYEVTETPWLTSRELAQLHQIEDAVERLYNSGRFKRTLNYLLECLTCTPFELFERVAESSGKHMEERITLDDYTALVYEYFSGLPNIDKTVLRDNMVCDRLATNASGRLPPVLYRKDETLKRIFTQMNACEETRAPSGVKRGIAWLYSKHCVVYADYRPETRKPVTGEYPLHYYYPKMDMA
ncbi:B12-binding domain-containing radical SAM protein [Acetanaerobacterium elongatum]|uniref:Radical SAM superfamily enzyme YgiQ, UPF0313 family n=1 Tax=Acetanaerobacterium elongatum TaxID=258515 RepID=A0A1G9W2L6_9FIRM|nr:radical SAM protein [Acetanaerobacterium elongatum]SDM78750.1 Radical SAM superfamily enzyme YgiQ, UPF0313 family [Acetanaerobacterium elongatum]